MKEDRIHLKSPGNWINDPNGFIYYKGMYHMFYQHFPYEPRWGTMHWGHAVSKDLVHWEHKGIALFPTKYEDQNGCFSGSAVEHNGRLYIYYTGVHYHKVNPDDIHQCLDEQFESAQMMITSEDGFHFDNIKEKKVIIPAITDKKVADRTHTRDPKVWRGKDAWYMVLGSTGTDHQGKLLFYKSENLTDWRMINSTHKEKGLGWMWECPDYFATEGGEVLIFSAMGILKDGKGEENHVLCMPVTFDEESCIMEISKEYQFLDYGLDLYAPQSTVDAEGRRVLTAWLRMPEPVDQKWIGMFCIPRVVEVQNNHIYFRVHPNVEKMYTRQIQDINEADKAGYRVSLDMEEGESVNIGGYRIFRIDDKLCTDRTEVFKGHSKDRMQFATPVVRGRFHLDIYVDSNLVEVFVNNGEYVISNTVYGLKKEISANIKGKMQICTLE